MLKNKEYTELEIGVFCFHQYQEHVGAVLFDGAELYEQSDFVTAILTKMGIEATETRIRLVDDLASILDEGWLDGEIDLAKLACGLVAHGWQYDYLHSVIPNKETRQ